MKRAVLLFIAALSLAASASAQTISRERFVGCFNCDVSAQITGLANDRCRQVSNNSWGDGIECVEVSIMDARFCETNGGSCYYIETGGGSDGQNGSGGGNGHYDSNGYCSPEYQSCF